MKPPMSRTELESDLLLDAKDYRDMARWLAVKAWSYRVCFDQDEPIGCRHCSYDVTCGKTDGEYGNKQHQELRDWLEGAE